MSEPPSAAPPPRWSDRLALALASGFGSGFSPVVPGTAGSAVGLLLYVPLALAGPVALAAGTVLVSGIGVWAASRVAARLGIEDPGLVVIDEIAGMWLTLLLLPVTPATAAVGFFAFRVMDVFKPWPARDLERLPGGWGIMADDLMAGVYANLAVRVAGLIVPLS